MKTHNFPHSFRASRIGIAVAAAIFMAGCASAPSIPAPTEQMAVARAAISNANSAGGNEVAPLQLKFAMEKMDGAERAMGEKDYARAKLLAEEALVDAKLAESIARAVKAEKAASALQEDNRVLRKELDRKAQ